MAKSKRTGSKYKTKGPGNKMSLKPKKKLPTVTSGRNGGAAFDGSRRMFRLPHIKSVGGK